MTMRNSAAPVYYDVSSQTKVNYSLVLGCPEHEFHIYTRLFEGIWFAHLERASGDNPTKRTAIACQPGATAEIALEELHNASAKVTGWHLQACRPDGSAGTASVSEPRALCNDDGDNGNTDEDVYHGNESDCSESEYDECSDREIDVPRVVPMRPFVDTRKERPLNRRPPGETRPNPRPHGLPLGLPSNELLHFDICIVFVNHGTYKITERLPMTQKEVLAAATRHCDTITGIRSLTASLKSVAAGGTKLLVEGYVSDLAAVVRGLPAKSGLPIFGVEVSSLIQKSKVHSLR